MIFIDFRVPVATAPQQALRHALKNNFVHAICLNVHYIRFGNFCERGMHSVPSARVQRLARGLGAEPPRIFFRKIGRFCLLMARGDLSNENNKIICQ